MPELGVELLLRLAVGLAVEKHLPKRGVQRPPRLKLLKNVLLEFVVAAAMGLRLGPLSGALLIVSI